MEFSKKYVIHFDSESFDKDAQKSYISGKVLRYTKRLHQMTGYAKDLDRFDDFSSLRIPGQNYEKKPGSNYGISKTSFHKNQSVILPHQEKAAQSFLRDLRGFGLLADVVGSGKTYEAGVVISELAARNKIRSLLFVVPTQVLDEWINVMEMKFGLGKGALLHAKDTLNEKDLHIEIIDGYMVPRRPVIVSDEDFSKWSDEYTKYLFDAIVVDEAHHLCAEEGEYAKSMTLLSKMIKVKKEAKFTYCLLLSATPHSGNLDHMFRLWYFIRLTGGNPDDFVEKEDKYRTKEFLEEKKYYHDYICNGSNTVMEFIQNVKIYQVEQNPENSDLFEAYLTSLGIQNHLYQKFPKGRKTKIINDFLDSNDEVRERVFRNIAKAYHNGVLRSIMIRQPNAGLIAKKKTIVNYLFFPTDANISKITAKGVGKENVTIDCANLDSDKAICCEDEYYSINNYINEYRGVMPYKKAYSSFFINSVVRQIDDIDKNGSSYFTKKKSLQYYQEQMYESQGEFLNTYILPINVNKYQNRFSYKFEKFMSIISKYPKDRVVVFFDYDLKKDGNVIEKFKKSILAIEGFEDRVIFGETKDRDKAVNEFNKKENAILVVMDAGFTEGVNLQLSSVIINFQVTHDPLSMDQRIGRIFRLGQTNDVTIYSLADMDKLEGYALMYFARIGLMTSNTGDATIIAGSNSERMVTIRCNKCKKAKLISKEEYDEHLGKANDNFFDCDTPECQLTHEKMTEICVYDFKCDTCGCVFTRSDKEEGYNCIATSTDGVIGIMCNSGITNDRDYYCRKICVMNHCDYFLSSVMDGRCQALEAYYENPNIDDTVLARICGFCRNKCKESCRFGVGKDAINGCIDCKNATCRPKPHVIKFDNNWEADCPKCKSEHHHGKIKPIVARTFATYVKALWDYTFDNGSTFCPTLLDEAKKVREIKDILDMDDNAED